MIRILNVMKEIVLLPLSVTEDVLTLGGELINMKESSTRWRLRTIKNELVKKKNK